MIRHASERERDNGTYDEDEERAREFDDEGNDIEPEMCEFCGRVGGCPCDEFRPCSHANN